MKRLIYADLYVGMEVIDSDGDKGYIISCDDIHNVEVRYYISNGRGLYCFKDDCEYKCSSEYLYVSE